MSEIVEDFKDFFGRFTSNEPITPESDSRLIEFGLAIGTFVLDGIAAGVIIQGDKPIEALGPAAGAIVFAGMAEASKIVRHRYLSGKQ